MTLLDVKNLNISFSNEKNKINNIVKNISFEIKEGQVVALVGESGSGKSITALSIMKLMPFNNDVNITGNIIFNKNDILKLDEKKLQKIRGNDISIIFQEPLTALNPLHTIEKQICEIITTHKKISYKNAKKSTIELLNMVGLEDIAKNRLDAYPHQLSGGQRQRVIIAMAIANNPKLLIADEPTTALDANIHMQIISLLMDLKDKLNISILFISHDLNTVKKISDKIIVLQNGKIIEQNNCKILCSNPKHEYTKQLFNSIAKGKANKIDKNAKKILNIENLYVKYLTYKSFFGNKCQYFTAIDNISFSVKQGETLGIVGESGSGKTSLAMAILRLISSDGTINFMNKDLLSLDKKSLIKIRKNIQIIFQDPFATLNPRMSIFDILSEGLKAHNLYINYKNAQKLVYQALDKVKLSKEFINRYPHEFSGGQRQRISIARALILEPKLIILDEPTSALDTNTQLQILDLLKTIQKEDKTSYICISHDLNVIKSISNNIIVLKNGKMVEFNKTDSIFKSPKHEYTKMLVNIAN